MDGRLRIYRTTGDMEEPRIPFQVTSIDITVPYPLTPRGNQDLLIFMDHV